MSDITLSMQHLAQPSRRGEPFGIPLPYLRAWRRSCLLMQAELTCLAHTTVRSIYNLEISGRASFRKVKCTAEVPAITPQQPGCANPYAPNNKAS